jgi:hypothetical protein
LTKGVLAAAVGHRRLGLRVLGVLFASAALGVLSLAYTAF